MAYSNNQNGWATSEDWARHRQTITTLYCDENKTLKEVMRIMREKHNFVATVKMYKFRFSSWGLQKNLKHHQVAELLAQQQQNQDDTTADALEKSSTTAVVIGGREVDGNRIAAYLNRVSPARREKIDAIAARSSIQKQKKKKKGTAAFEEEPRRLPSSTTCRRASLPKARCIAAKPDPAHINAPDALKLPEECVRIVQHWVHGAFDAGLWRTRREDGRLVTPRHQSRWINQVSTAADLIDRGLVRQGFRLLGACLDRYKKDVLRNGPMLFLNTYRAGVRLAARSPDLELFHSFLRFAHDLAAVVYPPAHPLRLLLLRLRQSGTAGIRQLARLLLDVYLEAVGSHVSPDDGFLVVQSVAFLGNFNWAGHVAPAIERGFRGLQRLEEEEARGGGGGQPDAIHPIKLSLAEALHSSGRYAEARRLVMEVLRDEPRCGHRKLSVYDFLLRDLRREGRHAEAAALSGEALRFCAAHLGPDHWRTARTKVTLSACLERAGDAEAARGVLDGFDAQWEKICQGSGGYSCSCGHGEEGELEVEVEVEVEGREETSPELLKSASSSSSASPEFSARPLELRLGSGQGLADVDVAKYDADEAALFIKSEEECQDLQSIVCGGAAT